MYLKSILILLISFGLSACNQLYGPAFDGQPEAPKITGFVLQSGDNTAVSLSRSVSGKIDHGAGTIVLDAPLKQADMATPLLPRVTLSENEISVKVNGIPLVNNIFPAVPMDNDFTVSLEKDGYKRSYNVHVRRWKQLDLIADGESNGYPAYIFQEKDNLYYVYINGSSYVSLKNLNSKDLYIDESISVGNITSVSAPVNGEMYVIVKDDSDGFYYIKKCDSSGFKTEYGGLTLKPYLVRNSKANPPMSFAELSDVSKFEIKDLNNATFEEFTVSEPLNNGAITFDESAFVALTSSSKLVINRNILTEKLKTVDTGVDSYIPKLSVKDESSIYIVYQKANVLKIVEWDGNSAIWLGDMGKPTHYTIASHSSQKYPVLGTFSSTKVRIYWWNGESWLDYGVFSDTNVQSPDLKWLALDSQGRILLSIYNGTEVEILRYE